MLTVLYNCNRLQSLRATYCAWVPHQVKTTQYSSFIISIIIIQCNLVKVLHQARDHDLLLPTPNIYIYYEQGSTRTQATPWRDQDNVCKILNLHSVCLFLLHSVCLFLLHSLYVYFCYVRQKSNFGLNP